MKKFLIQLAYMFGMQATYWTFVLIISVIGAYSGFLPVAFAWYLIPAYFFYLCVIPICNHYDKKGIPNKYKD
tara:strand:- start:2527 stop:2742 length:216 start_codon:yes stop_codon:yes gene_type:complete